MNLFGIGPLELLLIVILALIVFGPEKLPQIMGQVGKAIRDFQRATSELSDEFQRTIQTEIEQTRAAATESIKATQTVLDGSAARETRSPPDARPPEPAAAGSLPSGGRRYPDGGDLKPPY